MIDPMQFASTPRHIAIDAVGIRGSGGAVILDSYARRLPSLRPDWKWTIFLLPESDRSFSTANWPASVTCEVVPHGCSLHGRASWLNWRLPGRLKALGCHHLLSLANLPCPRAAIPQTLYLHQALMLDSGLIPWSAFRKKLRYQVLKHWLAWGIGSCRHVVVQTHAMVDLLKVAFPHVADRVQVISPGLERTPAVPLTGELSRQIETAWTSPRLIFPGQALVHKNHEVLLQALVQVRARFANASLLVTIPDEASARQGQNFQALRFHQLARKLGLSGSVIATGTIAKSAVLELLRRADLMVFPSLIESFGLPLIEAQSQNCPIVASDLPYAHDVAGDAALYFNPRDPADCAKQICAVLGDPRIASELRKAAARQSWRYDASTTNPQFLELLDDDNTSHRVSGSTRLAG